MLPSVMLRADKDLFLDGVSLEALSEELGVPIVTGECTGEDFIRSLLT